MRDNHPTFSLIVIIRYSNSSFTWNYTSSSLLNLTFSNPCPITRSIPSHSSSSAKLHRLPLKSLVSQNGHRSQELGVASHMIFSSKGVICPPFAWLLLPCNLGDSSRGEEMTMLFSITWKKRQRNSKLADQGRVVQSGLDALKIIKKITRLNVFENINKPGLEFNLGLVLIVLRTYWAWCLLNTTKKKKDCIRFHTRQVLRCSWSLAKIHLIHAS